MTIDDHPGKPLHRMRWWGWGTDGHDKPLTPSAIALLERDIEMDRHASNPPPAIDDVTIPDSRLTSDAVEAIQSVVGADNVAVDHDTRVQHSVGRSYPDLVRLRAADLPDAPDAVVYPQTEEALLELLQLCSEQKIAVVAFGGGTSVVGGVESSSAGFTAAIAVSTAAFNKVLHIDREAETATVQCGVYGPDLEKTLNDEGFTCGHFPQSFEFSTVGGWVSCRSAGQESSGYGRIDRNVIGLRVVTPQGIMQFRDMPSSAAGPDPRELFLGSEGTLGIITQVTLQLHRKTKKMLFDTYFFPNFEAGTRALQQLEQSGATPHLARLSDEKETAFGIAQLGNSTIQTRLKKYLQLRGMSTPCMAIFGFTDSSGRAARLAREKLALAFARQHCVRLGSVPGMMWVDHRFTSPYLRDVLMTKRVGVDTLETATTWGNVAKLKAEVTSAMEAAAQKHGTPAYVFCHISHTYRTGCSLYFTYFFREKEGEEIQQWIDIKTAAGDAIMSHDGTITHHHGIGRDHCPQFYEENTELFAQALRAVKREFDPAGILNPGKLASGPRTLNEAYSQDPS
ncbi:FAD-binding oxidoreductase [Corynebacterium sp. H113]|uniref:FAD-binding oxidoreductase n=1 Tax=Corynebacterium sp. H113 TaxID=3133419 RepID=UPI0030A9190E